jgi:DNA-binding FadR family transcriptional regulator
MGTARTALETLRAALDAGDWPAGARLPAERALAVQLRLGRGTLRKALDQLAQEGRIRRRVGEGTFVAETPAALLRFDAAPSPADVMEARRMLEPAIARAAALRARPDEISAIAALARPVPEDAAWRDWEERDRAFHGAVAGAARNPLLSALLKTLDDIRDADDWGRLRRRAITAEARRAHAAQHARVAQAISARDAAEAADAMRAHLAAVDAAMAGEDAPAVRPAAPEQTLTIPDPNGA